MRLLSLLLATVLGCTSVGASPPLSATAATASVADLQSKTVALVDNDGLGVSAYCSGVWVGKSTILTAAHCVRSEKVGDAVNYVTRADVYPDGGPDEAGVVVPRQAKLAKVDEDHDLALLSVAAPPSHPIAGVTLEPVGPGQRVFTMGAPLGKFWSYSSGEVAAVRYIVSFGHKILFVQATAPISGGNSGGGLFNDYGELVGVCHATYTQGQNMNLWIHYSYIETFLRS